MSLEGPCSVIRGMHDFPFVGNGSRSASRDHQGQHHHHQQQTNPMQHHRFNALASNSWEAPPPAAAEDSLLLPEVFLSPPLRSVSSLVLSRDFEDGLPIPRARRPRE
ncbi:unnamed protein product, partial [Laminaria digitata]